MLPAALLSIVRCYMGNKLLLYVEDEDASYLLFESVVQSSDAKVTVQRAADGEQALAYLRRAGQSELDPRPDLVVLDLHLPGKNGWELLSEMKADANLRTLPVVIFTSSALLDDKRHSLALGARDHLTKPFTYEGFLESIRTLCSYLQTA
jgi:CheY-like chemotaxis protein